MSRFEDTYYKALIATMSFEEASKLADKLHEDVKANGKIMDTFPKNAVGLTLDEAKRSKEYIEAKKASVEAFSRLRSFNGTFTKQFAKELTEARARRRGGVAQ